MKYLFLFFILSASFRFYGQSSKKPGLPEKSFEKFWLTFKDHYAFFSLKQVNWDSTYKTYRPLVKKKQAKRNLSAFFPKW